jgi:hypothetical protein
MLNFRKLEHTITGSLNGKPFNITRTPEAEKFLTEARDTNAPASTIIQFIESAKLGEIAMTNKYLVYSPITKEYFLAFENYRSKKPIPQVLVDLIEESYDKDIDFMPILKAWARLLNNPRYTKEMGNYFAAYLKAQFVDDVEMNRLINEEKIEPSVAREMATYQDISISKEGLLVTYKVAEIVTWEWMMVHDAENDTYTKKLKNKYKVIPAQLDPTTGEVLVPESYEKPDFLEDYLFTPAIHKNGDKFYSGNKLGYVYEIGKMQHLPKKANRNLQNTFGGGGLYTGGLNYIKNYKNDKCKVLVCFVNPADIISYQDEGQAFRTDAIFPNNVWDLDVPLKGIYHSSDYDKMSEERLEQIMKDAVAEGVDLLKEQATYRGDNEPLAKTARGISSFEENERHSRDLEDDDEWEEVK